MSKQAIANMNDTSSSSETVKVAIRCRPMNPTEMKNGNEVTITINLKNHEIFVHRPGSEEQAKHFTFDLVYDWGCTQQEIYDACAAPIIDNILEGYNGTIFAYG